MKRHIHIFHTNDIHSCLSRTPQIATVIQQRRKQAEECGDAAITVDVGDHMDRMCAETEGTSGEVNVAVMNETGYDLVTLGNNEGLTFPHDVLDRMYDKASFQVLLSNWLHLKTKERPKWMVPSVVREWFGCKVAFIAVTAPFNDFYELLGWTVTDPISEVRRLVEELRDNDQVDAVVLLSHLGLPKDEQIADSVPGIDVILGGHTHHLLHKIIRREDTYLAATGKLGEYVGEVKLTVDSDSGQLMAIGGGSHAVKEAEPHPRIVELLRYFGRQAEQQLAETVVYLQRDLPIDWEGESPFGNLLADSLLDEVDAVAAVVNTGQLLAGIPLGTVTRGDLHRLCPSPINPCRMRLSGKFLRQALEESLLKDFQTRPIVGFGFRGYQLGSLAVSGLHITYRPEAPPYQKTADIWIGKEPLRDEAMYQIATIDMFTFGIGYHSLRKGKEVEFYLPEFLRDLLFKQLQRPEHVEKAFRTRWHRVERTPD